MTLGFAGRRRSSGGPPYDYSCFSAVHVAFITGASGSASMSGRLAGGGRGLTLLTDRRRHAALTGHDSFGETVTAAGGGADVMTSQTGQTGGEYDARGTEGRW